MAALALPKDSESIELISAQIKTPLDLLNAVAPSRKFTHLLWKAGRKDADPTGKAKEWFPLNDTNTAQQLNACIAEHDIYYTPNEFYGWRLGRLLVGLNAFYVDIDVHKEEGCPFKASLDALDKISAARLPEPSMVVYTGRGAHIYWLFNRTPARALTRWQAVQRELVRVAGGDRNVVDCTRVLRMAGTVNSKADEHRKTVTVEVRNRERYDFDWLCDQIILPRAEIHDLRVKRLEKGNALSSTKDGAKAKEVKRTGRNHNSIALVWAHRYQDMCKIIRKTWSGGRVTEGDRNDMLYHLGVALAWIATPEALKPELHRVAGNLMPSLTEAEIDNCLLSVLDRSKRAAEGQKIDGQDPRYRFRTETLYQAFQPFILAQPELIPELRALVPPSERKARRKAQDATRDRVAEGRYTQTRDGYLNSKTNRMEHAAQLWREGLSTAQIAEAVGTTMRTIQGYIKAFKTRASEFANECTKPPVAENLQNAACAVLSEVEAKVLALREKRASLREIVSQLCISSREGWEALRRLRELGLCWVGEKSARLECGTSLSVATPGGCLQDEIGGGVVKHEERVGTGGSPSRQLPLD